MPDKGQLTVPEVQFWLSEAKSCEERQKIELFQRNNYPFLVNYFEGVEQIDAAYPHVSAKAKQAIINEYFPNTNSLISEIIYQNPDILLEATRPDAEENLNLMKSALSYLFRKADALTESRVALFDMFYAGYCAVEIDVIPPDNKPEAESPETEQEETKPKSIFDKIKTILSPEDAEKKLAMLSPSLETNFATAQGTYIRRYDPMDVPLDWRAERVKDRRYNLKKVWMSKAEFDAKYPDFKDRVNASENRFEYSKHDNNIHNRKVLLYEFQVKLRGNKYKTIIISPNVMTREIDSFDRPYTTNGFNMKIGTLHKYGKLYPVALAQINKTMNDEMNHYVRHLMEVAERNIPKYVTDKTKVKIDAKEALRSRAVNDIVEVDGNTSGAVTPLQPTTTSYENKELLSIFQDQKNKLWSVSESRISGRAQAKFATDLSIQESGFQARQIDIQEGLRTLLIEVLETGKDIIVTFWDGEIFLKVTGGEKESWHEPVTAPNPNDPEKSMVMNSLTDKLTADYEVNIDIASASRPNRQQQLQQMNLFMQQIVAIRQALLDQGKDINIEEIKRVSKEFGWNPDKIFIDRKPALQPTVPTASGETISPEEDAQRQAQAEALAQGGGQ